MIPEYLVILLFSLSFGVILFALLYDIYWQLYDHYTGSSIAKKKSKKKLKPHIKKPMRPWDIKGAVDSFTVPLWAPYRPKDFYFAINCQDDVGMTIVCIVPAEFFDKESRMFNDSMPIVQHIPNYLEEVIQGVYETDIAIYEVRRDLLNSGFSYNPFFQKYIDKEHGNKF